MLSSKVECVHSCILFIKSICLFVRTLPLYTACHPESICPHLSGGADDQVLKYDLTRYNTNRQEDDGPTEAYNQHSVSLDVAYECRTLKVRVGLYPEHILSSVSGRSLHECKVGTKRHLSFEFCLEYASAKMAASCFMTLALNHV